MENAQHIADLHAPRDTRLFLESVGRILDTDMCWLYQRKFHFAVPGEGCTLAVAEESAGRFRLEACRWTRPVVTLWALPNDEARLASVVRNLAARGDARVGV